MTAFAKILHITGLAVVLCGAGLATIGKMLSNG